MAEVEVGQDVRVGQKLVGVQIAEGRRLDRSTQIQRLIFQIVVHVGHDHITHLISAGPVQHQAKRPVGVVLQPADLRQTDVGGVLVRLEGDGPDDVWVEENGVSARVAVTLDAMTISSAIDVLARIVGKTADKDGPTAIIDARFAANAVVVGRNIVLSSCSAALRQTLEERGYPHHPR